MMMKKAAKSNQKSQRTQRWLFSSRRWVIQSRSNPAGPFVQVGTFTKFSSSPYAARRLGRA